MVLLFDIHILVDFQSKKKMFMISLIKFMGNSRYLNATKSMLLQ
jgi:hypothetical protein